MAAHPDRDRSLRTWMEANLAVQGYGMSSAEARALSLAGACGLVTATNFCIPSTLLAAWRTRQEARATA